MAKQDDYVRYTIRVPSDLYDRLKDAAGAKSVNAEITDRLEWSLKPGGIDDDERAEFTRGVVGGLIEAILLSPDPEAQLRKMREQMRDPALSKGIAAAIVNVYADMKKRKTSLPTD